MEEMKSGITVSADGIPAEDKKKTSRAAVHSQLIVASRLRMVNLEELKNMASDRRQEGQYWVGGDTFHVCNGCVYNFDLWPYLMSRIAYLEQKVNDETKCVKGAHKRD